MSAGKKALGVLREGLLILAGVCTALALCMDMDIPRWNGIPETLWNLAFSTQLKAVVPLIPASILFLRCAYRRTGKSSGILLPMLNLVFASIWLAAEGFRLDGPVSILAETEGQVLKSWIYFIGIAAALQGLARLLYRACELPSPPAEGRLARFTVRHPFAVTFFALLILWAPHLILSYPGNPTPSAYNQIGQVYGVTPWANFHPPFGTVIMGNIVLYGASLRDGNFGLFLYTLFQAVCLAAALAHMFRTMRDLETPRWLCLTTFFVCVACPYYTAYIAILLKDNLYACAFLLLVTETVVLAREGEAYWKSPKHVALWWTGVMGTILLRHNGRYALYPLILVLVGLMAGKFRRKTARRADWAALVCLLAPVVASWAVTGYLTAAHDIQPGSVREAFSLPFQQTARYVRDYGKDVTWEERRIIDKVLVYDTLGDRYNPRIADPVKDQFNEDATSEDVQKYFAVWFRQLWRHPDAYLFATLEQNYYVFYPFVPNDALFSGTYYVGQHLIREPLGVEDVEDLEEVQANLGRFYKLSFRLPGLNLLCSLALYATILLWLWAFAYHRRLYRWMLPALPVLLSLAVVIAAPVIQGHPRYAFPVIYTVPILLAYYMYLARPEAAVPAEEAEESITPEDIEAEITEDELEKAVEDRLHPSDAPEGSDAPKALSPDTPKPRKLPDRRPKKRPVRRRDRSERKRKKNTL